MDLTAMTVSAMPFRGMSDLLYSSDGSSKQSSFAIRAVEDNEAGFFCKELFLSCRFFYDLTY